VCVCVCVCVCISGQAGILAHIFSSVQTPPYLVVEDTYLGVVYSIRGHIFSSSILAHIFSSVQTPP
jgi:hypothetical protein